MIVIHSLNILVQYQQIHSGITYPKRKQMNMTQSQFYKRNFTGHKKKGSLETESRSIATSGKMEERP